MAEGEPPQRNGGRKTLDIGASLPASLVSGRSNERSINLPAAYPLLFIIILSTRASFRGHGSGPWGIMNHSSVKEPSRRTEGSLIKVMDEQ